MHLRIFGSPRLTVVLLALCLLLFFAERQVGARARLRWAEAEKAQISRDQASAFVDAIEQYCADFPEAGVPTNDRHWAESLAGGNPKNIRYLKVEKYTRDSQGRFVDRCGQPYVIETQASPGFKPVYPPDQAAHEFHVRAAGCGSGIAIGNRDYPGHPKFK